MLLPNSFYAFAAVLIRQVLAEDRTSCYTAMTYDGEPDECYLPTEWSTHTEPCTITETSTGYASNAHQVIETVTVDSYVTVTDLKNGVSTTTKTVTVSQGITATSTVTATTRIDVKKTIVVPAQAHFTPVQSSLPGFTNGTNVKRSEEGLTRRTSPNPPSYGAKSQPKSVEYHKYTNNENCVTKKETAMTNYAGSPHTEILTVTKAATSIVCPNAKETVTATSTIINYSTVSISLEAFRFNSTVLTGIHRTANIILTTTSTQESIVGTTTVNEPCLTKANYADAVSAAPISFINAPPNFYNDNFQQIETSNSFNCCNAAFNLSMYEATPEPRSSNDTPPIESSYLFIFDRRVDPDDASKVIG
ncbi:Ca2+-modulated nonselective cation channel polycystin [Zymoseptoria tritici IPO323]|uniref:Ca2+-modulated nonselective cation channel polycystin n=1 Tax=Zymoseptoria tritici (strain CBS 115943 / IPO323) TaxID=336722 RepID=F9X5W0_ZYMTI|nr:Ca2+-modulated nonselective cation channel polycystin [Zymoseptoria tritici IPO323]EGP89011.1 Ca2+-modulated nonselective cation channel polycystin [Zymoseptoria tritici IPO323]